MSTHSNLDSKSAHWLIARATTAFALGYFGGMTGHADVAANSKVVISESAPVQNAYPSQGNLQTISTNQQSGTTKGNYYC